MPDDIESELAAYFDRELGRKGPKARRRGSQEQLVVPNGQSVTIVNVGNSRGGGGLLRTFMLLVLGAAVAIGVMWYGPERLIEHGRDIIARIQGKPVAIGGEPCLDILPSISRGGINPEGDKRYSRKGKDMIVLGNYTSTDSGYWAKQPGGQHRAWDIQAKAGTPAQTHVELVFHSQGYNPFECCAGDWSAWLWPPGEKIYGKKVYFYYGHLETAPTFVKGKTYPAGTFIGVTNRFAHVHWHISYEPGGGPWGEINNNEWWDKNCSTATTTSVLVTPGKSLTPRGEMEKIAFEAADEFGIPHSLARATMTQESGGDPNSVSPVGATGLMQVMPGTAVGIAKDLGVTSYDLRDPRTNARFGMYYLSEKIKRYGLNWGLAAYNWGPGAVDGFLAKHPEAATMEWEQVVARWGGDIPGETQAYVRNILAMKAEAEKE